MKKIISISKTVLILFFRSGAGWGLIALSGLLAVFMFFATNSDSLLINELHLRIRYSLYAFSLLLNVALIYFSCGTLRKDIDERRFHTISSAPVHRAQIWLGKFLGVLSFGFIVFLTSSMAVAISAFFFIHHWKNKDEVTALKRNFFRTYYVCTPDLTILEKDINSEFQKRLKVLIKQQEEEHKEHELHHHGGECHCHELEGEEWRSRKLLLDQVRKEMQAIPAGKTGQWKFRWNPSEIKGDYVILRFKFYSNSRRNKVRGTWTLPGTDWKYDFEGYPFLTHDVKIPLKYVINKDILKLRYTVHSSSYVIFPVYHEGLSVLYDSGGLFKNYIYLLFFSLLHMATLIAMALTFSSLFSYSVAVFVATVIYITGAFTPFFESVLRDLSFHDQTLANMIFSKIIEFGIWITKGVRPFDVGSSFSDGLSIPFATIITNNGFGYIIYISALMLIGIFALTRKEIDRILQA